MEHELNIIIGMLRKIVFKITIYHWFEVCGENNDKLHIRNMQIKYKIIIIVQYTIAENAHLIVQYQNIYIIKPISITHPLNFHCRITNNPWCIVYLQLIGLKITERSLEWVFLALKKANNNRALFEVS